jgi:acetyl esterase
MNTKYAIDPAYTEFPDMPFSRNLWKLRILNLFIVGSRLRHKWADDIAITKHSISGVNGNKIKIIEVAPKDLEGEAPAIVYFHGGAFFMSYAGVHLDNAQMYAREARCRVFVVDYRLSTKAPFPAAQDDSQSALEWVFDNAAQLEVDRNKLILSGDSAGGCLAASCAQMTLDRNVNRDEKINILAQFLIYPVTDCETKTESATQFTDTPLWTHDANKIMWDVYLRGSDYKNGIEGAAIPQYASPIHREDFSGLPPAYIEPTEFDPLRDEAYDYGRALEAAGIEIEIVEAKGSVHGYEFVDCETTRKYQKLRVEALKKFLI